MKLENTVFVWRNKGKLELRTFEIGEVDLNLFNEDYSVDGAIHEEFRLDRNYNSILHFSAIIKHLMKLGYPLELIHFHCLGILGYKEALEVLKSELTS